MTVTRREFMKGGVAAFTIGVAAPAFLSDIARAQGASSRNLVVLYLGGGMDALSVVIPYQDSFYATRRPTIAVPTANVLQIGTDSNNKAIGLHPRLTGLRDIFNNGHLAVVQRCGYQNSSRSHFQGTDIWATANPSNSQGAGWLGRYLDVLPAPVNPLVGWNTARELPHVLAANQTAVPSIPSVTGYAFASPNGTGTEAQYERAAAFRIASHVAVDKPHLSFVNGSALAAFATLDRVAQVGTYVPSVTYANNGFAQALRAIAGAISKGVGTKVFFVSTGGYDTHSQQGVNQANGAFMNLMATLGDGIQTFYTDLRNQGLLNQTLVLQFSEFGRRIAENGSAGTDHGAGSVMMAMGGGVRGGIYGTAPSLDPDPNNPTLENGGQDVRFETDFRSVYSKVLDSWLGVSSVGILGADFRTGAPGIL